MIETEVAIEGRRPYGLSLAAYLRHHGVEVGIVGQTMQLWFQITQGGSHLYLKSLGFGTSIFYSSSGLLVRRLLLAVQSGELRKMDFIYLVQSIGQAPNAKRLSSPSASHLLNTSRWNLAVCNCEALVFGILGYFGHLNFNLAIRRRMIL